jgi:hypothetical protein
MQPARRIATNLAIIAIAVTATYGMGLLARALFHVEV